MKIGNKIFDIEKRPYLMGILNVTPDSFSDGGRWNHLDDALRRAEQMISEGADLLDIGGESTRPGYEPVSVEEEIHRVVPVIEAIKARFDTPVSLDTYKYQVAEAGILAGADLINDIWGLQWDDEMAKVIAKYEVACCLMHNRRDMDYICFLEDVKKDIDRTMEIAKKAGIPKEQIMLDPGIGFAKTTDRNLEVLNHLEEFHQWQVPLLLGVSRKSVIGNTLGLPTEERVEGTIALNVMGRMKGAGFFRVHDIRENKRALDMAEAVLKAR